MKEKLYDVLKYGLIIIIAGVVFYLVYPRYYFISSNIRGNKMTGKVEKYYEKTGKWEELNYSFGQYIIDEYGKDK